MALPKFHPDEIVEAGRQLEAEGVKVNGWSLRDKLGGGRPDRLQSIWDSATAEGLAPIVTTLPQELQERIQKALEVLGSQITAAFAEVYQQLADQATARVSEVEHRLADERIRFDQENAAASNELERLEAVIVENEAKELEVAGQLESVSGQLQVALLELAQVREKCVNLEGANLQLAVDAESSQRKADEAQRALSEQALLLGAANQQVADIQAQVEKLGTEVLTARRHEQAAREREATLNGQLATLQGLRVEDARVTQELRHELSQSQAALGTCSGKHESAMEQIAILQDQIKQAFDRREADRQQIESLTDKLKGKS